jgi:hypothetical protein
MSRKPPNQTLHLTCAWRIVTQAATGSDRKIRFVVAVGEAQISMAHLAGGHGVPVDSDVKCLCTVAGKRHVLWHNNVDVRWCTDLGQ